MADASAHAELVHEATEVARIDGRAERRREDETPRIAPPGSEEQPVGALLRPVALQVVDVLAWDVEASPASHGPHVREHQT